MSENRDIRLKRLHMRSMRRGIREMDLILTRFAADEMTQMTDQELDTYEEILDENDQDLYQWVTGQMPAPEPLATMIARIAKAISDGK